MNACVFAEEYDLSDMFEFDLLRVLNRLVLEVVTEQTSKFSSSIVFGVCIGVMDSSIYSNGFPKDDSTVVSNTLDTLEW